MPKTVSTPDVALKYGLPCNVEAERILLGAILHDNSAMAEALRLTSDVDFMLEKHRRIFIAMDELYQAQQPIDRVTLANALMRRKQLESVDGMSYLASLDEGMPDVVSPGAYAQIVRDCALLRRTALLCSQTAATALAPDATPSGVLEGLGTALASISSDLSANDPTQRVSQIVDEIGINNLLNPSQDLTGIETGFWALDDCTTGLQRQTLTILAARPSAGKSAMMTNMAMHIAQKCPVAIFSMEMSKRNLIERMISAHSKLNLLRIRSGLLSSDERRVLISSANYVHGLPIYIDDTSAQTYQQIAGKADRLRREHGVAVTFLDYIQQMGFEISKRGRDRNDNERLTEIAEAMKSMSKRQDMAVVALSQLSRNPEHRGKDHRPLLSDLRGSGGIEQAADLVLIIFREFMYRPDKVELKDQAVLIVAKQRNGPTRDVPLTWRSTYASFDNQGTHDNSEAYSRTAS